MTKGKKNEEALNYAQLHDIPQVTIADAKEQILLSWKAKQWRGAFMLVGEAGMGKSQVVHQVAHEVGARVCDIRTAHYGLMGAGIPSTKEAKIGFFKTLLPESFPESGEKAMVVFDELNQGLPHAISMFFSLIEDRRMFDYLLPKECMVVGMMNPATDKYSVTQIETNAALRRRLKWLYCIPSFQAWYPHAQSDIFHFSDRDALGESLPCHPDILSFMETLPKLIYDFDAQRVNKQYMCPATIQTISLDTYLMERNHISTAGSFAETRFAASIGLTVAKQLVDYLTDTTLMVKPEEVLRAYKGKIRTAVKKLVKKDRTKLLDLGQGVLTMLFAKKTPVEKIAKNFVTFLGDIPSEVLMQIHTSLNQMAEENNAGEYLTELMYEMADYPGWREIHKQLDKNSRNVDDDLMKDWKSKPKKK
jgi:hypothetical protein